MISAVPSLFARHQLAEKLQLCVKGLNPVLFNVHTSFTWFENLVAISGRGNDNRVDGAKLLADILKDGLRNHNESKIILPKQAVLQDQGKT